MRTYDWFAQCIVCELSRNWPPPKSWRFDQDGNAVCSTCVKARSLRASVREFRIGAVRSLSKPLVTMDVALANGLIEAPTQEGEER